MTTDATTSWLRFASQKSVVLRSLRYAVVVGSILTAINQGDALLRGDITLRESARASAQSVDAGAQRQHATSR